ncbi:MAG: protein YgfX [Azonexus sp.]
MQLPITIGLHRSRLIDAFIGLGAGLASLCILFFPRSTLLQAVLLLALWSLALLAWRQCSPRFSAIRLERDGRVSVRCTADQEFSVAELLPGATVHPWLSVLRLQISDGAIYPLVLAGDSLNADAFRRLRVFLRWRADFSGRGDDA